MPFTIAIIGGKPAHTSGRASISTALPDVTQVAGHLPARLTVDVHASGFVAER